MNANERFRNKYKCHANKIERFGTGKNKDHHRGPLPNRKVNKKLLRELLEERKKNIEKELGE